jgi:hypothetical protein
MTNHSQTQPPIPSSIPPTIGYGDENEDFTSPYACSKLKEVFDKCFFTWYSDKFLKGLGTKDECQHFWTPYQVCVRVSFPFHQFLFFLPSCFLLLTHPILLQKKLRAMDIEKAVFPESNPTSTSSPSSTSK